MLTGTQGMVEYTVQGQEGKILTINWNIPKLGKERIDVEITKPFTVEHQGT